MSNETLPITRWPAGERPRERLLEKGPESLSDAEIVALLLRTGTGRRSAVDLARSILRAKEQAHGWEKVSVFDLRAIAGVGPAKAAAILAAVEFSRRQALRPETVGNPRIQSSRQAYEACRARFCNRNQEAFLVLGLDAKKKMLGSQMVSLGTLTQSLVHPREVFQPLVAMRAAGAIVAHNHPSGDALPSPEDDEITRRLKDCAMLLSIPLVDHLVLGEKSYFSYADAGWRPGAAAGTIQKG